ncbi:MAG: SDR family NAD(P)-dependent oxidoreductase [Bacteroidota bacterium]
MNVSNNKVLITGGSSGIGLALAAKLKSLNNYVVVTGRDQSKLDMAASKYKVDTYRCDLADPNGVKALIKAVKEQHPDINLVINNAGLQYNYDFTGDVSFDKIEYEVEVNFNVVAKLCSAFLPMLLGDKESAIVNVSSGLAISPKKSAPVYCATKAGVHMFTKALRYQMEGTNVKVFEVLPPLVDTPMTEGRGKGKMTPDAVAEEFIRGFEKNRFEMNIGKVKLLRMIQRISPAIADSILKNN